MTTFDDREAAFERKFVLDEDQRFRAIARGNRYFGLWAADKLGKSGDEAADYAKSRHPGRLHRGRSGRCVPQGHG